MTSVVIARLSACAPSAALTAGVHDEMGVASCRPFNMFVCESASSAVSQILDNSYRRCGVYWRDVPTFNWFALKARKGYVKNIKGCYSLFHFDQDRWLPERAALGERSFPKFIEVFR